MKLSNQSNLNLALKGAALLVLSSLFISHESNAAICQVGNLTWQCVDDKNIVISNETGVFEGTKPKIALSLQYRQTETGPFIDFVDGKVPSDFTFEPQTQWRLIYSLKEGLKEAVTETGIQPLPEGKFDEDGDPIDNQKIYESIQWYVHAPKVIPTESDAITLSHPFDEFELTAESCVDGYTISASATPFTYTGVPNSGEMGFINILGADGLPLIIDNCDLIEIINEDIYVVIKNQDGIYLLNQTDPNNQPNTEAKPGDELTVDFFIKDLSRLEENGFINVTDRILPTVVWGYFIAPGDDVHGDGSLVEERKEIWMDGSQPTSDAVPKEERNTTGMQTFKIQEVNEDARALQDANLSEQGMRVILKFGVTQ